MKKILIALVFTMAITMPIFAQEARKYPAKVNSCYDADTCDVELNLGFGLTLTEKVRFYGIDCCEIRTKDLEEKERGLEARDYVRDKIEGKEVIIEITKRGKFGRPLSVIYYINEEGEEVNLNQELIDNGMCWEYFGGSRN